MSKMSRKLDGPQFSVVTKVLTINVFDRVVALSALGSLTILGIVFICFSH